MRKRQLAYLRRYTRVGSILLIFLIPIILFFLLKSGKYFYKNVPTLYTLDKNNCSIINENKATLLFIAKNEEELNYCKKIYSKLTEQLIDIEKFIPPLFIVSGQKDTILQNTHIYTDSLYKSFIRECLQAEVSLLSPANVFFIKPNYEVGGVYALHKFTDRKKLKEALTIYLYLKKHPEYEAKK